MKLTKFTLPSILTLTLNASCTLSPNNQDITFEFNTKQKDEVVYQDQIPEHNTLCFLVDKSDATLSLYKASSCDSLGELLLETPIVHGGVNRVRGSSSRNFPTPNGDFYIQSSMKGPITYYPPSHDPNPNPRPGAQTHTLLPFTTSFIEPKKYGFLPGQEEGVGTLLAIHGSKNQEQFSLPANQRRLSHGCIRTPNSALDEINRIIANTANIEVGPFSNMKSKHIVTYDRPFHVRIQE